MRQFSSKLQWLLLVKGACRFGPPLYILWSIFVWSRISTLYAVIFAALSINYVLVLLLTWTAPAMMNGPWRVRPWQTLVLLGNAVWLPIAYHRAFGHVPWLVIVAAVMCFGSLILGSAIYVYLHDKAPAQGIFAQKPDGHAAS